MRRLLLGTGLPMGLFILSLVWAGLVSAQTPLESDASPATRTEPAMLTVFEPTADTTLRGGPRNRNFGTDPALGVRRGGPRRALVRFDLDAIAATIADGELLGAVLSLEIDNIGQNWGPTGRPVRVHRLRADWSETAATWQCAEDTDLSNRQQDCATPWNGGDFDAVSVAEVIHRGDLTGRVSFDLTDDVRQALSSGEPFHGWLLEADLPPGGRVDYASREADAARRPRLIVSHQPGGDAQAPTLEIAEPVDALVLFDPEPEIRLTFDDPDPGVDLASLRVRIGGVDVTAECVVTTTDARCSRPLIDAGPFAVMAEISDLAGNRAETTRDFELRLDQDPPTVEILQPEEGALVTQVPFQVSGRASDDGAGVVEVRVDGQVADLTSDPSFTDPAGTGPSNSIFSALVGAGEGPRMITVTAEDSTGLVTFASRTVRIDTLGPELVLERPRSGQRTHGASLRVAGRVTDPSGVATVRVAGLDVPVLDGVFDTQVSLVEGSQNLVIEALDIAGNRSLTSVPVERVSIPEITILQPADGAMLDGATVTVVGRVSDPTATVTVQGLPAVVDGSGEFTVDGLAIAPGGTLLSAVATSANGLQVAAKTRVLRDVEPPRLALLDPPQGATVHQSTVVLRGRVDDLGPGAGASTAPQVFVDGIEVPVAQRGFAVARTLVPGDNVFRVEAVDASGNRRQEELSLRFEPPTGRRLEALAGNGQLGVVGTPLETPLAVMLRDSMDQPVVGQTVVFRVTEGGGQFGGGRRRLVATTDTAGRAEVSWILGDRAGMGSQRVEATAVGFGDPVVFLASTESGPPAALHLDAGDQQVGVVGQPLGDPLVAVATDAQFNRLPGVEVGFQVVAGQGIFADSGEPFHLATTDAAGRARARLIVDDEEGVANQVVESFLLDDPEQRFVTFVASATAVGDPAATRVEGRVVDNTDQPIPGATARLLGTGLEAPTDADGRFVLAPAPVGVFHLEIDGSTATRPGVWPTLDFEITTLAGQVNTVGRPIYLLPLAVDRGIPVSETEGGVLALDEFPGFALEVAPGSATFPDGSRSGVVSVTRVHGDRVPMVPGFGQQPRFVITIQPTGTLFDPPARLSLPNVDGLSPGASTEFYSFDHDVGSFVAVGPATVSDDGTQVVADTGIGVIKAGWHCGGRPVQPGTAHNCPACQVCNGSFCAIDAALDTMPCDDGNLCTLETTCDGGACGAGRERDLASIDARVDGEKSQQVAVDTEVPFSVAATEAMAGDCPSLVVEWDFGDGGFASGESPTHVYETTGDFTASVVVSCEVEGGGSCDVLQDSVEVQVRDIAVEIQSPTSGTQFTINNVPEMPEIEAVAQIVGLDPDPTADTVFNWTAEVSLPRGTCRGQSRDVRKLVTEMVTGPDYTPDFETPAGGPLRLAVEATVEEETVTDEVTGVQVIATNPTVAQITSSLPHDTLRKIACEESCMLQFRGARAGTSECPLFSNNGDGGVGLFQLTLPPPSFEQNWDWQENLRGGVRLFQGQKARFARILPGQIRSDAENVAAGTNMEFIRLVERTNLNRRMQGLAPLVVVVPDFTEGNFATNQLEQFERDNIRAFNGFGAMTDLGRPLHQYRVQRDMNDLLDLLVVPNSNLGRVQWEEVPGTEEVRGVAGKPDYVERVLAHQPDCSNRTVDPCLR